jgi:hypothetical protein
MKIRNGFVSNSSSSSFIVISKTHLDFTQLNNKINEDGTLIVDNKLGNTEFGLEPCDFCDIGSRIIFSYLQSYRYYNNDRLEMLEKVIKDHTKVKEIVWCVSEDYDCEKDTNGLVSWGYIDHQSSSSEGMNTEMFDSYGSLENFIFSKKSYIHTDNDNH